MRKYLTMFLVCISFIATAQFFTVANYTDTLTNAETKNYAITQQFPNAGYVATQVYVDHITGAADSTHVRWQVSLDNSAWYTLSTTYLLYTGDVSTSWKEVSFGTTDGGFAWCPTSIMAWRYMRMQVQHYATGTATVKAYLYFYPLK